MTEKLDKKTIAEYMTLRLEVMETLTMTTLVSIHGFIKAKSMLEELAGQHAKKGVDKKILNMVFGKWYQVFDSFSVKGDDNEG